MSDTIIVERLGKRLRRHRETKAHTLQESLTRGLLWKRDETFWALRDVSFTVGQGRSLGVIGRNGAGKSTLLRLIGGIGRPDEGRVTTYGRIGALLDLGAGFHPDLTGRENVFINGTISGLTRREIVRRFDDIVAFAELEDFIDSPLRTYSSGMELRLAFAIAVHTEPEVLIIDEVLAVGDSAFQQKCLDRVNRFKDAGCTIVVVSHEAELVEQFCDDALWLRGGKVAAYGPAREVVGAYSLAAQREIERNRVHEIEIQEQEQGTIIHAAAVLEEGGLLRLNENRFGTQEMQIVEVRLLDAEGSPVEEIDSGSPLQIVLRWRAHRPIPDPKFCVAFIREDRTRCFDLNTDAFTFKEALYREQGEVVLDMERIDLVAGTYVIDVGIYEQNWTFSYDDHRNVYPLTVLAEDDNEGVVFAPHHWDFRDTVAPDALRQPAATGTAAA